MARKVNYNKNYFKARDHLDLLIAHSLEILSKENQIENILDVGCGTGRLVEFFRKKGFVALGCDIADEAVKMARKINGIKVIKKAQATHLPFNNGAFELVTAISVIEHLTLKKARIFLNEATRVLKPNGFIFIITPNFRSPFRYLLDKKWFAFSDPTHVNFYTPSTIKSLLEDSGFMAIRFRMKTAYNVPFDWYLPKPLRNFPMPLKNVLNYIMISSPLSTFRDSIWVAAHK